MRFPIYWLLLCGVALLALSANDNRRFNFHHALDAREAHWVDSIFQALTPDERIGQLLVLRAHSDKDAAYEQQVEDLIRRHKVGGLCFFQGTPERQAELTNRYHAASRIPLLIAMDAEWGLGMRMKESTISYPRQLMLGAIDDNRLLYDMGREIARQCRRLGVHVNYAPVADVNNNPNNPVINDRSFGEDRDNVTAKCFQYMMGLQDGDVLACAKHFPGHGDTDVDSHYDLPQISHTARRLDSLELFPFRVLSQYGIGSMMVSHLNVLALDARDKRPSTLSQPTITGLLRERIGFDGLICTDAMEMKGVAKYFKPGEADVEALRAGNDMISLPGDAGAAVAAIQRALADKTLDQAQVDASIRRVLRAKYRLGLNRPQFVDPVGVRQELNQPEAMLMKRTLIQQALTLVRDQPGLAGFTRADTLTFASVSMGNDTNLTIFQENCSLYAPIRHFNLAKNARPEQENALLDSLRGHAVILVSLHDMSSKSANNFGLTERQINLIRRMCDMGTVALTVFGNPYSLRYFDACPIVLEAYNEDPMTQEIAAQALFGAVDLQGKLPVTACAAAAFGQGIARKSIGRLQYNLPESVGLSTDTLLKMEPIVRELINTGAAPGCQILVAKDGKVVWNKAYGRHTYEPTAPAMTPGTLFDLASITKVAATTISTMRAYDEKKLRLDVPISTYIPELVGTNKANLVLTELLIHEAGLQPWIPFYESTLTPEKRPSPLFYNTVTGNGFTVPVAKNLYMSPRQLDSMWQKIYLSELRPTKSYKYSDLGLFLTARILRNLNKVPLDAFAEQTFYKPMGLQNMLFNPWKRNLTTRCAPTEEDNYFRYQRLQGYVHDMGAAMLGGVSGHAGLFSNANDLAKIFQMLLNGGAYGGKRYLQAETVKLFTARYPGSTRRGIGFDMKELDKGATQNMCAEAGTRVFGHTGFTGNAVWADPEHNLIFIFLSNRTYPTMTNNKLITNDYRLKLQSVVYRSLKK
jgi:beta-N-acetylhexosaminidase